MSNEIIIDFATGEIEGQKHMDYIDYVFDNMNKADAKEAMKNLVSIMLEVRAEDREIIQEYDELLEETHMALTEAINMLNSKK